MIATLFSLALAASSSNMTATDSAPTHGTDEQSAKPAKPKRVCEKVGMSGSNIPKRICRTITPPAAPAKEASRVDQAQPDGSTTN